MSQRVWVITGTNSGFGLVTALHVLKQGDKVIASVRSLSKFPKELKEAGAEPLLLDLNASDEEVQQTAEKALQIYGHVDVLVNNAGTMDGGYGPVEELALSDIRKQFQANLFATIAFTQPFIRHFRERRAGTIINISTCSAINCPPSWGAYSASKSALDAFTDALHRELLLFNVRVYSILPGYFPTNVWKANPFWTENSKEERQNASKVYTDLETQGFDTMNMIPRLSTVGGQIGDTQRFAERVWEIVEGTGVAGEVMGPEYHPRWFRIPLGSDSGDLLTAKAKYLTDNVASYKKLWQSTDVEPERVEEYLEQYQ